MKRQFGIYAMVILTVAGASAALGQVQTIMSEEELSYELTHHMLFDKRAISLAIVGIEAYCTYPEDWRTIQRVERELSYRPDTSLSVSRACHDHSRYATCEGHLFGRGSGNRPLEFAITCDVIAGLSRPAQPQGSMTSSAPSGDTPGKVIK